jgi:hypothetical protein
LGSINPKFRGLGLIDFACVCLETRMNTGVAEGIRVYPARIIQSDLDEREFMGPCELGIFAYGVESISHNISDPLFYWIIG